MRLCGPHTYHSTGAASVSLPIDCLCVISFGEEREGLCNPKIFHLADDLVQPAQPTDGQPEAQRASKSPVTRDIQDVARVKLGLGLPILPGPADTDPSPYPSKAGLGQPASLTVFVTAFSWGWILPPCPGEKGTSGVFGFCTKEKRQPGEW